MKLYARVYAMNVNSSTSITVNTAFGFASTPDATNGGTPLDVTPPGDITALTFNQTIADSLVIYVNSTYSTSFHRSDVIFVSGAVSLISL